MKVPVSGADAPLPWRRLGRIAALAVAGALLALLAGRFAEAVVLGSDAATARARVEAEVRSSFTAMARGLEIMARGLADAPSVAAAAQGDTTAARRVFSAAESALAQDAGGSVLAITVYAIDGRPLAWCGRASELPPARLEAADGWFFARGTLGLRLVYVTRVIAADGTRVGAVAAERSLDPATALATDPGVFRFPTRIAAVSIPLDPSAVPPAAAEFDVPAPSGERLLSAFLSDDDISAARERWRRASRSIALIVLACGLLLMAGPLLDWRHRLTRWRLYLAAIGLVAAIIVGARLLLRLSSPADWSDAVLFSGAQYASAIIPLLLTSPFDFLLTALAAGGLVALLLFAVEAWRVDARHRRVRVNRTGTVVAFVATQLAAGAALALLLWLYDTFLRDTIASTTLDLLHFSMHPWVTTRLALQVGLVIWHAALIGCGVLLLRVALAMWVLPRSDSRLRAAVIALWALPLLLWQAGTSPAAAIQIPMVVAFVAVVVLTLAATRLKARYRHGSQAFRLIMTTVGLVVPAIVLYPAVFQIGWQIKAQLVETNSTQALTQRQRTQDLLRESLLQIDRYPGLERLVAAPASIDDAEASTDRAFAVWSLTELASYPLTSSVELHGPDGRLVSRFALNLPEDLATVARSSESSCAWDMYEEVSPFFAEERRVLHAGRQVCAPDGTALGSIVVHAMLDYANLPFISSQNPYVELMRPEAPLRGEGISGRDVEFAFYGWSRTPIYSSGARAWPLSDEVFARIEQSRDPVWARLERGGNFYDVHIRNDRGGIYALGFPVVTALDHLVNIAELTVLVWVTYVLLLAGGALFGAISRRGTTARALVREVRASFFRKLLLAFILATVVPVVALALATRAYVADQLNANVEEEAVRTASAARRVVEDLVGPRALQQGAEVNDNLMVWVSRLVDQDVNVFSGPRLLATSERNLFASGVIPTRTQADVYRALQLQNEAVAVARERVGTLEFLVAATSIATRRLNAMLTVPLTSRQQEIETQIDTLDRRVLLGALLFVFGGAGIGYWLAERIADPVNRLTRATRRIARGELDARIAATSSDELKRLVQDFNQMAAELQRQQKELERTHRLEAWAEMARQVAHEIKNPLTPIQLNAEHLRRVHADRGEPMSPVLEECVATILTQVSLLRQIASEFSNFASSPVVKASSFDLAELVRDTLAPYAAGLGGRITLDVGIPESLPPVHADRNLVMRAFTNIVENALHAMPGGGTLGVHMRADDGWVRARVTDTGVGMDAEALARAFEPYFSTKTTGTGLGLPIAKRNIELSGGTVAIASEKERGTTVDVALPVERGEDA